MILKYHKGSIPLIAGIAVALFISVLTIRSGYFEEYKRELTSYWMSFDPGFSDAFEIDSYYWQVRYNVKSIIKGAILGFEDRPAIERIDIDIKFDDMQVLLDDRENAIRNNILIDPSKVPAKIRYQGSTYKAQVRLKGDLSDHWRTLSRMSMRVSIKGKNSVLGFKTFSIHRPRARQHPYDQTFQELHRRTGGLSSRHEYAEIYVNGVDWGVMNIEEHISKELLEKQHSKESIVIRFGNENKWKYKRMTDMGDMFTASSSWDTQYLIGDDILNNKLYQSKKYLESEHNRRLLSYIVEQRLLPQAAELYDINQFAKVLMLTTVWNNKHTLAHANTRYYFNPYTLKLEPLTTDQGEFFSWAKQGRGGHKSFDPLNYQLYRDVVATSEYKSNFQSNLVTVKDVIKTSPEVFNFYHSYFPLDRKRDIEFLQDNMRLIWESPQNYLPVDEQSKVTDAAVSNETANTSITDKMASVLSEHIHARHYSDGSIDIYNLLPSSLKIISLNYKGRKIQSINQEISSNIGNKYKPELTLRSSFTGVQDNELSLITELNGFIREYIIPMTYFRDGLFNPLSKKNINIPHFIQKVSSGSWEVLPGNWIANEPIRLHGDLHIPPGVQISFSDNSYLIIQGAIQSLGSKDNPVIFKPAGDNWKGIYILNARSNSTLQHTKILHTKALEDGLLKLTGGVTFYRSQVKILDSTFDETIAEDALNIVRSDFIIQNSLLRSTVSDGFDGDFSTGSVNNSHFDNIGGDALDFSGSTIEINETNVSNVHDKAVSVGEASNVKINGGLYTDVGVAFASKDGSVADISNVVVKNVVLDIAMTYVKKSFYEKPSLLINNSDVPENASYSRQNGTSLVVNGEEVASEDINIKTLYKSGIMKK